MLETLDGAPGDLVFVGAGRGGPAIYARAWLEAQEVTDRRVWLADRFRADGVADLNAVRDSFDRFDLLDDQVRFLQGDPSATLTAAQPDPIALLSIGSTNPADVRTALDRLHGRLVVGGGGA